MSRMVLIALGNAYLADAPMQEANLSSEGRELVQAARDAARVAQKLSLDLQRSIRSLGNAGWSGYAPSVPEIELLPPDLRQMYRNWIDAESQSSTAQAAAERWLREAYAGGRSVMELAQEVSLETAVVREIVAQSSAARQWPLR